MKKLMLILLALGLIINSNGFTVSQSCAATGSEFSAIPPFITSGAPPLVMLVMGRNHKLYYEAYNDASDLNGDGKLDIRYNPDIDYYGYFDSYKCYTYNESESLFEPVRRTSDKKCTGDDEWSGDFLNYLTMSRMDTLRKVLYGGYRSVDTEDETVLERVFIPQDAHSWAKEYTSPEADGYKISDYTPFTAPLPGTRHLFGSTTLSANGQPLLRVALNNSHRVWEWASKESPVLDDSIETGAGDHPGHPGDHDQFEEMVNTFATSANRFGSGSWLDYSIRNHEDERFTGSNSSTFGAIDGYGNPWGGGYKDPHDYDDPDQDNYLAIFTGKLNVQTAGDYEIAVDGDDAVEVIIDGGTANEKIIGYYGPHGANGGTNYSDTIYLSVGEHSIEFRMEEAAGADKYYLYWKGPDSNNDWSIISNTAFTELTLSTYRLSIPASTITNYVVRVKVCDPSVGLETNCKQYPNGNYKPVGILQRHGESGRMYFGLITGSWAKNTSGGVLRKGVGNIRDEIDQENGIFWSSSHSDGTGAGNDNGIIQTINKMHIYGYSYSGYKYNQNCGWITSGPMSEGQCRDWGNPIAEMMYEAVRYFAGKKTATPDFDYEFAGSDDSALGLPKAAWDDPYESHDYCSKPFMLVLSDINPTYDADSLPGVDENFGSGLSDSDLTGLSVKDLADFISNQESLSGSRYIGQSGALFDGACTAKDIDGLGSIRGLCPEEPTKGGGYYAASIAYYGKKNDLSDEMDNQSLTTYAVALASPLPRIEFNIGGKRVTLVPFAKTIGSTGNDTVWSYWPTNTIVDFYVQEIGPTSGTFRINYEDVEQGADHDMDSIVTYEYQLVDDDGNPVSDPANATAVDITLTAGYASGSYIQHAGYIISGTTKDGTYLEVTDSDTGASNDFLVFLDTPPGSDPLSSPYDVSPHRDRPGESHNTNLGTLPLTTTRRFYPASSGESNETATLLKGPLWYAAKWGGFDDKDGSGTPNLQEEWDKDEDGVPDTYFYVTNPLRLEEQLNKSFADILNRASSGTAVSVISNTRSGEGAVYQSVFYPSKTDSEGHTVRWAGQLHALLVDAYGNIREDSNGNHRLDVVGPDLNGDGTVLHEDLNMNCTLDTEDLNGNGVLDPGEDQNGNGLLDSEDLNGNGVLDVESVSNSCVSHSSVEEDPFLSHLDAIIEYDGGKANRYYDVNGNHKIDPAERLWNAGATDVPLEELNYLWNTSQWLNSDLLVPLEQRNNYLSDETKRYIFSWVDGDGDGVVDPGEIQPFVQPDSESALRNKNKIYPYLLLYPTFDDIPEAISDISVDDFDQFEYEQVKRIIGWIRGKDYLDASGNPVPLEIDGSDIPGTEMRSRLYAGRTWRLADITYSTPTLVGRPAEGFHLLYSDESYAKFAAKYQKRRSVIYAGANDGMLHAFNAGFFDPVHKKFCREIDPSYNPYDADPNNDDEPCLINSEKPELGAELWAYVPFNLLPHLYWLTQVEYNHIYYVDGKPKVFDAKIFEEETACQTDVNSPDCIHPEGWGTVMVVGMRLGGATIYPDTDRDNEWADETPMKSAFIVMDITDPERPPRLLAELTMPEMGFSTSYPSLVTMRYNGENKWFLAFGSGPADPEGNPDKSLLNSFESFQKGKFYLVDLVSLAHDNQLKTLDSSGNLVSGLNEFAEIEEDSFVTNPVTVDFNLDYNVDAVYFGSISKDSTGGWAGKMYRVITHNSPDTTNWELTTLLDAGQPISAAPAIGLDDTHRAWVFFGTGRFFVNDDKLYDSTQSFYGVKEPIDADGKMDWSEVNAEDVIDTTALHVHTDKGVSGSATIATWAGLISAIESKAGWKLDFDSGERNVGQAALLGGVLSFTTFTPSDDLCSAGGESSLWALYYKTGTAHYRAILGTEPDSNEAKRKISLGSGLASSPSLHVGRSKGSVGLVQTSTGDIRRIEMDNPYNPKSGKISWRER